MKMRVMTVAVVAALASPMVWAASEGGDTWSELQPVEQSVDSASQSTPALVSAESDLGDAYEGSEGGDTWSSLQALRDAGEQPSGQASGQSNIEYAGQTGGSEGGDTWSSLQALRDAGEKTTQVASK